MNDEFLSSTQSLSLSFTSRTVVTVKDNTDPVKLREAAKSAAASLEDAIVRCFLLGGSATLVVMLAQSTDSTQDPNPVTKALEVLGDLLGKIEAHKEIAERLKMDPAAFSKSLSGKRAFLQSEIEHLISLVDASPHGQAHDWLMMRNVLLEHKWQNKRRRKRAPATKPK